MIKDFLKTTAPVLVLFALIGVVFLIPRITTTVRIAHDSDLQKHFDCNLNSAGWKEYDQLSDRDKNGTYLGSSPSKLSYLIFSFQYPPCFNANLWRADTESFDPPTDRYYPYFLTGLGLPTPEDNDFPGTLIKQTTYKGYPASYVLYDLPCIKYMSNCPSGTEKTLVFKISKDIKMPGPASGNNFYTLSVLFDPHDTYDYMALLEKIVSTLNIPVL